MRISDWSSDVCSSDLSSLRYYRREDRLMSGINFKRDYGYSAASPAWFVMCPDMTISPRQYESRELAEVAAAELAHGKPGHTYQIVATVATVTTEVKIVGQNFDPEIGRAHV